MDATTNKPETRPMTELELVFRSWRGEPDAVEMARISNAANEVDDVDERNSPQELLNYFSHPGEHFDAARDVVMVEHDGLVVGYGWHNWIDTTDRVREGRVGGYVHPDWTRRGIGRRLLGWLEARARASVQEHPTELPAFYGSWVDEKRVGKRILLEGERYTALRWFYDMRRDGLDAVDVPEMPEGLEIRPMGTDRAVLRRRFVDDE